MAEYSLIDVDCYELSTVQTDHSEAPRVEYQRVSPHKKESNQRAVHLCQVGLLTPCRLFYVVIRYYTL